jgi:hypothetical protein
MEIKGVIKSIEPTKVVSEKFKSRQFVVQTQEQYPQTIQLQLVQGNCDTFNMAVGQEGTFAINLKGREWTNPQGEVKVFNTIECWAWAGQATEQPQAQAPSGGLTVADVEEDSLPF